MRFGRYTKLNHEGPSPDAYEMIKCSCCACTHKKEVFFVTYFKKKFNLFRIKMPMQTANFFVFLFHEFYLLFVMFHKRMFQALTQMIKKQIVAFESIQMRIFSYTNACQKRVRNQYVSRFMSLSSARLYLSMK